MALMPPKSGDTYLLAVEDGLGVGSLVAGSPVEVIDVVDPGTPGTGDAVGDPVVVFAVWETSTVLDDALQPSEGVTVRHVTRPLPDFLALVV